MISMFDNAYKQQPTNEELGAQTFFANVRTGNWKVAQQVRHLRLSRMWIFNQWPFILTGSYQNAQTISRR